MLKVAYTEPGTRGDTASGSVTKVARLETGLEVRVPLFVEEGEQVKVHTETRESRAGPDAAASRPARAGRTFLPRRHV